MNGANVNTRTTTFFEIVLTVTREPVSAVVIRSAHSHFTPAFFAASGSINLSAVRAVVARSGSRASINFSSSGTAGQITYDIPRDQVDPDAASQSLTPTSFNLNIGGQNFSVGMASFTTAPTLLFAYGEFQGVNFALDTSATPGFAYTSVSMSGLNVTIVVAGTGQQLQMVAQKSQQVLILDFAPITTGREYQIDLVFRKGREEIVRLQLSIGANATAADVADLVATSLAGNMTITAKVNGKKVTFSAPASSEWTAVDYMTFAAPGDAGTVPKGAKFVGTQGGILYKLNGVYQNPGP